MPTASFPRLQKILSAAGVASRRAAERLIVEGRVSVNRTIVRDLGSRADPARDEIHVDGRRISIPARRRYVLLYKPRGYVTTRADPQGRPTVLDLVAGGRDEYLYPVGRLDYESEGLLLLTNDGELAARLTHPRHEVPRTYEARVRGVPSDEVLRRIERGIVIDGRRTAPGSARLLGRRRVPWGVQSILEITIHEGRNRQVRKMCAALGLQLVRLRRTRIGPVADSELKPGGSRDLTPREVAALRAATSAPSGGQRPAPPARSRGSGTSRPR